MLIQQKFLQNFVFFQLPGKAGLDEAGWAIHCKLTCLIWLGVMKNKADMLIFAPEEYEVIVCRILSRKKISLQVISD